MRAIPDSYLCYPVLITLGNGGFGSGFFLYSTTAIYLVTAKHVLFDFDKLIDPTAVATAIAKNRMTRIKLFLDLQQIEGDGNIKPHATADVVVVKMGELKEKVLHLLPGSRASGETPSSGGIMGAPIAACSKFDDVLVANDIFVFGYPKSIGLPGQLDADRPLLRKGIVAGKDPNRQHIIIDCPIYQGNSGGLVMEVRQVSLESLDAPIIGVVSTIVPFVEVVQSLQYKTINTRLENSGYAVVTPIDRVLELVY